MFAKEIWRALVLFFTLLCIGFALAATDRYEVDPLGRLTRAIEGTSSVTDYRYDAAGNMLEVRTGAFIAPPAVTAITPASLRRNGTVAVTITGSNFAGANLTTADSALAISQLQVTPTEIKFALSANAKAVTGPQTITMTTAGGSVTAAINVAPLLPKVNIDPAPLAIPPDSVLRQITLRLSNPDTVDHTLALSASNSNIVVSPASLTIPAGQLSVAAYIRGISAGQATISLTSATLGAMLVPVFITSEFVGVTTSMAPNVGVDLQTGGPPKPSLSGWQSSPSLGVLVGSALQRLSPNRLASGGTDATLNIEGIGLANAQTVSLEPDTGVTLGAPLIAQDGRRITVPVSVAVTAPRTQRRLIVKSADGIAFAAVSPFADRLSIVEPVAQIDAIEPLFGVPDTTFKLTVRGRNLQAAHAILFNPANGIATDAAPDINADGTALTAGVALPMHAAPGDYVVSVATPAGTTSSLAGVGNLFRVVTEMATPVAPITAPSVGVTLQEPPAPATQPVSLTALATGVTFGPVATTLSPAVGVVGQDVRLTVSGHELSVASGITITPDTGLTVGALAVAADGKSVSVPVAVAADAPQTVRQIRLMAGPAEIPFASARAAQWLVSVPMPEVDSVTPITMQIGQPAAPLVVRGRHLNNASALRIVPPDGIVMNGAPVVEADGTALTVYVSAAAQATPGRRLVTVITPAGESSAAMDITNTLNLHTDAGNTLTPVAAALVGVVKREESVPAGTAVSPLTAAALGVLVQQATPAPVSVSTSQFASRLGVGLGPVAFASEVNGFAPGFEGSLIVNGSELSSVSSAAITPATGLTLGKPVLAADGRQVVIPLAVAPDAAHGVRKLQLMTASGPIEFVDPFAALVRVGPGVPRMDSLSPILAKQGDVVQFTIRGANLHDARAVTATPAIGLTMVPDSISINAAGTELTVSFTIEPGAPLGARVMQVVVPGAASDPTPLPANTFTVFAP